MSLNSQFSLGLELSNVFPIGAIVATATGQLLKFARALQNSGSDIVVEEDLAAIFGRGTITSELEKKFKEAVKVQTFISPFNGGEIRLDSGPGPTMHRALMERRYLATVIQLSLLAWTQSREELAAMLATCMRKRTEMRVEGASCPGVDGLTTSLEALNSQTSNFAWNFYIEQVDTKLRSCFPDYKFHRDYIRMAETSLLGAMDYLYLVQSLPDNRRILISNQVGSITLIVWAHYILGLTVMIFREEAPQTNVRFGASEEPQVMLQWKACPNRHRVSNSYASHVDLCQLPSPEIRLLDEDMTVILQTVPSEELSHIAHFSRDRHPLLGYGRATLHRMFNARVITPDSDPVYEDAAKLITALAIHVSSRITRKFEAQCREEVQFENLPPYPVQIEVWRVLAAAKVIFSGIKLHHEGVAAYVEHLADSKFDKDNVPPNFTTHLKRAMKQDPSLTHVDDLLEGAKYLARIVLLFSCVINVESCAEIPITLNCSFLEMRNMVEAACWGPTSRPTVTSESIFSGIVELLRDDHTTQDALHQVEDSSLIFLRCCFGWSVFLDTIGDKDPADVKPHLIHIQKGVPTNTRTNERKFTIADGLDGRYSFKLPQVYRIPPIQRKSCLPRAAAQVTRRREYWTTRPHQFEMVLIMTVEQNPKICIDTDFYQHGIQRVEDWISCRAMHEQIWETFVTPSCTHDIETKLSRLKTL